MQKKVLVSKKKPAKPMSELSLKEYATYRKVNPYRLPQDPELVGTQFWNKSKFAVFYDVLKTRKNLYVSNVKTVSLEYMRADLPYFGECWG